MESPSRSGVFDRAADDRVERFTESISFDHRLFEQDIRGSIAHAQMLAQVDLLSDPELDQIVQTLQQIEGELKRGTFPFQTSLLSDIDGSHYLFPSGMIICEWQRKNPV